MTVPTIQTNLIDAELIKARMLEYGLKAGPETIEALRSSIADIEAACQSIRITRSYLQEPVHTLRLWTK